VIVSRSPDSLGTHEIWQGRRGRASDEVQAGYTQDLGSIEVGKLADLLVLTKDALQDIRHEERGVVRVRHTE
jgi:hypothetical protein